MPFLLAIGQCENQSTAGKHAKIKNSDKDAHMKLLEKELVGKRKDPSLCEDGVFFNSHFAAVIDGCSSQKPSLHAGKSSGVIAKDLILEVLDTLPPESTMEESFLACNAALASWYQGHGLLQAMEKDPSRRCSAYLAMVSKARKEVWILGDCQALVAGHVYTIHKPIDTLMENLRALYIEVELQGGKSEEALVQDLERIQKTLSTQMAFQPIFQNSTKQTSFSYFALDGFFTNFAAVQVVKLGDADTQVVLGSDGYPQLLESLHATERRLAALLSSDPLCFRENRSTKGLEEGNVSFDDRSYLRVIV